MDGSSPLVPKPLVVAQAGIGYWGPNLLRNLVGNPRCRVKTAVDFSEERRNFVSRLYPGVNATADLEAIFSDKEIDAVVIATPASTHFEMATRCLEAGKHVLVEKPFVPGLRRSRRSRKPHEMRSAWLWRRTPSFLMTRCVS